MHTIFFVEGSSPLTEEDTIRLRIWNLEPGAYELEFETSRLPADLLAFLEDSYLQTSSPISATGITRAGFTVSADAGSSAANRFRLVFGKIKPAVTESKIGFSIAPNPAVNGVVNIFFNNQAAGRYAIRMVNNEGKTVFVQTLNHAGGNSNYLLNMPAPVTNGIYQMEIMDTVKKSSVLSVFVINR